MTTPAIECDEEAIRRDERSRILHEWLEETRGSVPELGDAPQPSQIHLRNLGEATREQLIAEIHGLDHRLRWQYRHNEQGSFVSLMAAKKVAGQRDDAELACKTLEIALKHRSDLCTELQRQRDAVLVYLDEGTAGARHEMDDAIRKIYTGEAK